MSKLNFSKLKKIPSRPSHSADSGKLQGSSSTGHAGAGGKIQVSLSRFFFSPPKPRLPLPDATAAASDSIDDEGRKSGGKCIEVDVPSPFRKRSLVTPDKEKREINKRQRVHTESQRQLNLSSKESSLKRTSTRRPHENEESGGSHKRQRRSRKDTKIPAKKKISDRSPRDENGTDSDEDFSNTPSTSKSSLSSTPKSEDGLKGKFQFSSDKGGKSKASASPSMGPLMSGMKYTPLEVQFVEIKQQHPDTLLFVECGYKYKFFGQDAEIAAKELNIFCHPDHNFLVASIPVHRLFVHIRRLVAKGHKVGVVKQTETAALKAAGDTRSAPFRRKLTALYTKSTLIGEDVDPVSSSQSTDVTDCELSSVPSNYLLCLSEFTKPGDKATKNAKVEFGLVAIQPATGDIVYDSFCDNDHLSELDTRIHHIQPVELLLPIVLTERTERLVQDIVSSSTTEDDGIRIERMKNEHFEYCEALEVVSAFYREEDVPAQSDQKQEKRRSKKSGDSANRKLQEIISLPVPVICCLAALLRYLKEFHLHRVLKMTSNLVSFSSRCQFMKLDACALRNLEIFKNQMDGSCKGSLFWALDHTKTRFGSRLLRKWLAMPLMDISDINSRQDAVAECLHSDCEALNQVKDLLIRVPDLEKGICSIYHKKCSSAEFYVVIKSLCKLSHIFSSLQQLADEQLTSDLLKTIFTETPSLLEDVRGFLQAVNEKAAREGNKTKLFCDTSPFPGVVHCQQDISRVLGQIQDHRREVRRILQKPSLEYITVSGLEFLIEVKNNVLKDVPNNWVKISFTKQVSRFHTPFLVKAYKTLSQLREQLAIECQNAWLQFLDSFGNHYFAYRKAVKHLAALDCLFSLAELAQQEGYSRPIFSEEGPSYIHIENGKHPVVSTLLGEQEQYVPNDTHLERTGQRCMIITGPNMGGKSSYIRQVALITIMAQVGSWVPAESARLGVLDAIYTRMGASDNIYQRRSTFMVELQEASDILSQATERSLVILDELGRGTSTHDGVAIAHATARHFIQEVKCLLLFVTHYPPLAELERLFPDNVANHHMGFLLHEDEKEKGDDVDIITFLYQLVPGMAARSYGLNVARLAEIPTDVIKMAATKSRELEESVIATKAKRSFFNELWGCSSARTKKTMEDFKTAYM